MRALGAVSLLALCASGGASSGSELAGSGPRDVIRQENERSRRGS